jgi:hypothetical protein
VNSERRALNGKAFKPNLLPPSEKGVSVVKPCPYGRNPVIVNENRKSSYTKAPPRIIIIQAAFRSTVSATRNVEANREMSKLHRQAGHCPGLLPKVAAGSLHLSPKSGNLFVVSGYPVGGTFRQLSTTILSHRANVYTWL